MAKRPQTKSDVQRTRESRQRHEEGNKTITYVAAALAVVVVVFIIWQIIRASNASSSAPGEQLVGACEGTGQPFGDGTRPLAAIPPASRNDYYSAPPETIIDTDNCYEAVISTAKGEMRLRLFEQVAPITVNNFVFLASQGFYDGTEFHRVMDNFMAQGGDPTGTGSGGPGYAFVDEVDPEVLFDRRGLLAMANSGPATNGSQFFITFTTTDWLNGLHTIFGELIEGDDVLSAITIRTPEEPLVPADIMELVEIFEYQP
ncbi:MAG: peptidylprolyl isomerase [Chloroflexi bacterium]|nr:peptidylprolyl isomerase [Chloroflexota bacterium]